MPWGDKDGVVFVFAAVDQENDGTLFAFVLARDVSAPAFIRSFAPPAFLLPKTKRSKSSEVPPKSSFPFDPFIGENEPCPADLGLVTVFAELEESSLSFLVCSRSILLESDLINVMNAWNCCKSNSGPKLKFQSTGKTSIAKKSESAIWPTCWKTLSAAIMTAGSFVLIALTSGTIFSCTVNLSRTAVDGLDTGAAWITPSRPSPVG